MHVLIWTSLGLGLLLILMALPLLLKKVPPNEWYGLRVPATLQNQQVWYAANTWMAKRMIVVGVVIILGGVMVTRLPLNLALQGILWSAVVLIGVLVFAIGGWRYANKELAKYGTEHQKSY